MRARARRERSVLRIRRRYRWRHPYDCGCLLCHGEPIMVPLSGFQVYLMSRYG